MSEYVIVESEHTDDPDIMLLHINQRLTENDEEVYATPEEGQVGSTIAQTIFSAVDGIRTLTIRADSLLVQRDPTAPWEYIIDDLRDALRDFFL